MTPQAEERIATIVVDGVRKALASSDDHKALRELQGLVATLCEEQRAANTRLMDVERRLEDVAVDVQGLSDDLRGDEGIVAVVRSVQPCVSTLERAVLGDRQHPEENKGLVVRVSALEKVVRDISKPAWIVLTAILTTITTFILANYILVRAVVVP